MSKAQIIWSVIVWLVVAVVVAGVFLAPCFNRGVLFRVTLLDGGGLGRGNQVLHMGVDIGTVSAVDFDYSEDRKRLAFVSILIRPEYRGKIRNNSEFYVGTSQTFPFTKCLCMDVPEEPGPLLEEGATIPGTVKPDELDRRMKKFADYIIEGFGDLDRRQEKFARDLSKEAIRQITPWSEKEPEEAVDKSESMGQFRLVICRAEILGINQDGGSWDAWGGKPDCFAKVWIDGTFMKETGTVENDYNPEWNLTTENFALYRNSRINIELYDEDGVVNDLIGECSHKIDVGKARSGKMIDIPFGQANVFVIRFEEVKKE
ncbi:MAG: MCE family protein [Planctomycetota bacterium]|nr:MAG: MCE family protein [Planctomycetota bacterium]